MILKLRKLKEQELENLSCQLCEQFSVSMR